jgi:hypothetical protein
MNHYIKKCKECQTVIGQCRCPAENKFVEWAVCEKCSQKTDSLSDYEFVPNDSLLASALDTAEKLAKEADEKFCTAFGGDGETVAYWLSQSIAGIRAALATQKTNVNDINEVVARVRFALEHPNDDVVTVGDVTTLLDAYESAVRERDEEALAAVRAFEALASGRVETLWLYAGEWRVNSRGRQYSAPDPLDVITKALEAPDAT